MHRFGEFNIKVKSRSFEGDKIKIVKILNRQITVHDFKIEESKVPAFKLRGTGQCMHLQISVDDEKYIIFTSSRGLIEAIQQIPMDGFPFTTTIVQESERYRFT